MGLRIALKYDILKRKKVITIFNTVLSELAYTDIALRNIEAYEIAFEDKNEVCYIHCGRKKHLLHLITSGRRTYEVADKCLNLKAGTVLFIPDGTEYRSKAITVGQDVCRGIGISFEIWTPLDFKKDVYYRDGDSRIAESFREVVEACQQQPIQYAGLREKTYGLISLLSGEGRKAEQEIQAALLYIQEHFRENMPVCQYARQCLMSESHFRKRFREIMGVSPLEYRNRIRLAEARRLYLKGIPIHTISEMVGFEDPSYLTKLNKKYNGVSLKADSRIV